MMRNLLQETGMCNLYDINGLVSKNRMLPTFIGLSLEVGKDYAENIGLETLPGCDGTYSRSTCNIRMDSDMADPASISSSRPHL